MTARNGAPARERPPSQGYGGSTEARPNSARAKAESGAQESPRATEPECGAEPAVTARKCAPARERSGAHGSPRATEPGCGAEPHVTLTRRELAILRSIVYGSLFDYPMTLDELQRTLVECDGSAADVLATFRRSEGLRDVLEYRDGFFFPAGRGDLVVERRRREARSRAFLERHRSVLRLICALPFVRMVALSGSIAHLNLEPEGDLDLFIVTRGHHVWTVTLSILVLTKILGSRRAICANFVVSDSQLTFEQQDLFAANQIIHLKPLVGADVMPELFAANPFVARFYPNAVASAVRAELAPPVSDCAPVGDVDRAEQARPLQMSLMVEAVCRSLYGWYLRRKARSWRSPEQVRLGADCLKLHTRSHRNSITERFDAAVAQALERAEPAAPSVAAAAVAGGRRGRR